MGVRKRDLCLESKETVLSMRHGYLMTVPHVMLCYYAGSLNDSGVTVNECVRDSGLFSLCCQLSECNAKEASASRETFALIFLAITKN